MHRTTQGPATTKPKQTANSCPIVISFTPTKQTDITDISMVSPTEGWAVGDHYVQGGSSEGLIFYLVSGQWQQFGPPFQGIWVMRNISMISSADGWAVGNAQTSPYSLIVHYDGQSWTPVAPPNPNQILKVQAFAPGDVWFLADPANFTSGSSGSLLHLQNGVWTIIPLPFQNSKTITYALNDFAVAGQDDVWVVGSKLNVGIDSPTFFAHYQGGRWLTTTYDGVNSGLQRIAMSSPTNGWAINEDLVYHFDGSIWSRVSSAPQTNGSFLTSVSIDQDGTVWVSGGTGGEGDFSWNVNGYYQHSAFVAHMINGQWQVFTEPYQPADQQLSLSLNQIAQASQGEIWAVGRSPAISCQSNAIVEVIQGVFLHFDNGQWSEQLVPAS